MGQLRAIGRGTIILELAILAALLSCVNMPVSSNASGKQADHWILALNSSPYLATNEHPLNAPSPATVPQLMTFYGWPDNDPPGNAIAYPHSQFPSAIHESAGGTGTYVDPITMASDPAEWPVGTKMYVPFLRKYVVMEDLCAQCVTDWQQAHIYHIDVWMNSNATSGQGPALRQCQNSWTQNAAVTEVNPPPDRMVDLRPLFDPATNTCLSPASGLVGDINNDGIVDIRDYGIWRQNFGQTNCGNPADLNGDCNVDVRDYGIWRANFGLTLGAAARPSPVVPSVPAAPAATSVSSPTPTRSQTSTPSPTRSPVRR
jgi:hypothetical protein